MSKVTTTDKRYQPTFLESHSDYKNIYYDDDLAEIRKVSKNLSDILKRIEMRFARHETITIARSVFDYISQRELYFEYPHMYYDFRFGDTRICIGKKKKHGFPHYFVNVVGFNPDSRFSKYISEFGYGDSDTVEGVFSVFCELVRDFILTHLEALF